MTKRRRHNPIGAAALWILFGRDADEARNIGRNTGKAIGQTARAGVAAGVFGALYGGDMDKVRTAAMVSQLRPEGGPYAVEERGQKYKGPKRIDVCICCGRVLPDEQGAGELCAYCATDPMAYEVIE